MVSSSKISPLSRASLTLGNNTATVDKTIDLRPSRRPSELYLHTHGLEKTRLLPTSSHDALMLKSTQKPDTRSMDILAQHAANKGVIEAEGISFQILSYTPPSSMVVRNLSTPTGIQTLNLATTPVVLKGFVATPTKPLQTLTVGTRDTETTLKLHAEVPGIRTHVLHQCIVKSSEGKDLHTHYVGYASVTNNTGRNIKDCSLDLLLNQVEGRGSFEYAKTTIARGLAPTESETAGGLILQHIQDGFSLAKTLEATFPYAETEEMVVKQALTLSVSSESKSETCVYPVMECVLENASQRMAQGTFEVIEDGRVIASTELRRYIEVGQTRSIPGVGTFESVHFSNTSKPTEEDPSKTTEWTENSDGSTSRVVTFTGGSVLEGKNVGLRDRTVTVRYALTSYDAGIEEVHVSHIRPDGGREDMAFSIDPERQEVVFDVGVDHAGTTGMIDIQYSARKTVYKV
jgi:hypothetical protein